MSYGIVYFAINMDVQSLSLNEHEKAVFFHLIPNLYILYETYSENS